mgnify:CR=1 FL=1
MIKEIIDYLSNHTFATELEIRRRFNLSEEEWELIRLQLEEFGYIGKLCNTCRECKIHCK